MTEIKNVIFFHLNDEYDKPENLNKFNDFSLNYKSPKVLNLCKYLITKTPKVIWLKFKIN